METTTPLLAVDVSARYADGHDVLRRVRVTVERGEILGLVGQSGSGKSTLALAILGLLTAKSGKIAGSVQLMGRELMGLRPREMRELRGREIALVLQSPLSALNPALTIGAQLREAWMAHDPEKQHWLKQAREGLRSVSLPDTDDFLARRPSQISVGQGQRVLIAMATMHRPALLIADEPTSALDMITQAEILELFAKLNQAYGMAILYISHDLASVSTICHRIAILHDGEIVESGKTEELFRAARHPYTQQLLSSCPHILAEPPKEEDMDENLWPTAPAGVLQGALHSHTYHDCGR